MDTEQARLMTVQIVKGGSIIVVSWVLAAAVRRLLRRLFSRQLVNKTEVKLIAETAFFALLALGVISGIGTMGFNVSALVASLGLGGFALGFALRDAVSNVLAGVLVLVYRPFSVGQRIAVSGFEGVVSDINLRYTVLRAEGQQQLIPNQMLFTNPVRVFDKTAAP